MTNKETPVLLLTGYLGSGKTTLLNRILSNRKGIRFAVIVNDLGEINIDAGLIQKGGIVGEKDDSLVALQNGCICCTLKINLVEQLSELVAQERFDYIVIEASGICEPEPIAQTICSIPYMEEKYSRHGIPRLDCIVTVVDALRMRDEFGEKELTKRKFGADEIEGLIIQQIEFCNIILLNKASEVSTEELGRIRSILKALQPDAEILPCDYGDVELDRLLHTGIFDWDRTSSSATWIRKVEGEPDTTDEEAGHEHEHEHEHEHSHEHSHEHGEGEAEEYGIGTFVYKARAPFNITLFDDFVARKLPKNVIRSKGICYFSHEIDTCYIFDQAGRQISLRDAGQWYASMPAEELYGFLQTHPDTLRDWDENYGDRMQKIVFIGQHLDRRLICSELDKCLLDVFQ